MSEKFYTILTAIGKAKIANSGVLGTKVNFVKLKVGDGNGSYYNPTEDQTDLINTVWEGNITHISVDEKNPNWINIEIMIPANVGGFMIREYGAFDNEGNMLAIAKCAESYKPLAEDGSTKELLIKMILAVSNTENITLKIDPTIIFAKKSELEVLENKINNIKVPVTKVNEKIGDVVLTAEDIKCTNGTTIETSLDDKASNKDLTAGLNTKVNNTDFENYKKDYVVNNAFGRTSGTSTNYTLTLNPAPTSYKEGMQITIIPHTDSTGSPYLNINGLGNSALLNQDGTPVELKANIPYSLVRVGNSFFIRSSNGNDNKMPQWMNNAWINASNLESVCAWATASSVGDNIYLFGGYTGYGASNKVSCYNSKTNTWINISNMSASRRDITSAVVGSNIHVLGYTSLHESYNVVTNTWSSKASPIYTSDYLSADSNGTYIYVSNVSKIQRYDTITDKWDEIATIPTSRYSIKLSVIGDSLYAIGGHSGDVVNKNEVYNLKYNTWSTLSPMSKGRSTFSLSKMGNLIYCIGGISDNEYETSTVEVYYPVYDRWKTLADMNQKRSSSASASIKKNIYVMGGAIGKSHNTCLDTVECYIQK